MYRIGSKVRLKVECMRNPMGSPGIVYETYKDFDHPGKEGISVIFQNGEYCGFSYDEQQMFFKEDGLERSCLEYKFTNVMQLVTDLNRGYFFPPGMTH